MSYHLLKRHNYYPDYLRKRGSHPWAGKNPSTQSPTRKVVILSYAPAEFTDSFHPQIQAIEAMREWAFDRYRVARRTSSEKPRLRISSPPDRSVAAAVSADEFGARSSGSLPPPPAPLFLFSVTVLEPPLRSR